MTVADELPSQDLTHLTFSEKGRRRQSFRTGYRFGISGLMVSKKETRQYYSISLFVTTFEST
ncbi:hypothetical protein BCR37DRAFT_377725 [Protomyces lactucae-debilis]|uniref:Uncharacterized protein n=1 Tax=Protomyces lactucae-debilis TaxID=2754530 RepID=A0A1Y2FNI3_PROLT|nr:uncharacterized protein BCR37DRAFT_377725 [Protomyces lactucae-debilis]ORY84894.1 hypothetical protein BCR37DRAFT_377725 [Protomyces lactucae-debilis]